MHIQVMSDIHWRETIKKTWTIGCSLKSEDSSLSKVIPEAEHLIIIYFNWYLFEKKYNYVIIILINICTENSNKCL